MPAFVCDVENSVSWYPDNKIDNTPYNTDNKLVSVGFKNLETNDTDYLFLNHIELEPDDANSNKLRVQALLDRADLLIGHYIKYDLIWLRECGFRYDGPVWDTGVFEYVFGKGIRPELSLAGLAEKYKLSLSKLDTLEVFFAKKINTDRIPKSQLQEYGIIDIEITAQIYKQQIEIAESNESSQFMMKAVKLMNDFLPVLTDMQRAGVKVNLEELAKLKEEFQIELKQLHNILTDRVIEVMGNKPYNLGSPDDVSAILYSRVPRDKGVWKEKFHIGSTLRGATKKANKPRFLRPKDFANTVNESMRVVKKVQSGTCVTCKGSGKVDFIKKDGSVGKKPRNCRECKGRGIIHTDLEEVAGFKLTPRNEFVSSSGFALNKDAINYYLNSNRTPKDAKEFLINLLRFNKVSSWLESFIGNIEKFHKKGMLHTEFDQTITVTGRLSSSKPNLQNQSKRDKSFPIRRAFISRFDQGKLYEGDFGQLEFRVAAILSGCREARKAILDNIDCHIQTMNFYHGKYDIKPATLLPKLTRQGAKAETFGPLYGKITEWTEQFYKLYPGIESWHKRIMDEALTTKELRSPSGRIYAFPNARPFLRNGRMLVSGHTQIKNYPVQGFATGDVVLLVLMDIYNYLKDYKVKSVLCLQVHDSALVDAHPDEFKLVEDAYATAFDVLPARMKERFDMVSDIPLAFELERGDNWLEMEIIT